MAVFLVNAVMLPSDGSYTRRSLSKDEFRNLVREAYDVDSLISRIEVPIIAEYIKKLTEILVETSEEKINLVDSDQMLVCQCTAGVNPTAGETFPPTDYKFLGIQTMPFSEND